MAANPRSLLKVVLTHEAGHAVAALVTIDQTADIFVKARSDQPRPFAASYRIRDSQSDLYSGKVEPIDKVVMYAAGAKAEEVCLGITDSAGFVNDLGRIMSVRSTWEERCDEARCRASLKDAPTELLDAALAMLPHYWQQLKVVDEEIASNFARTGALIEQHGGKLKFIASAALASLDSLGEVNLADGLILLTAAEIRALWVS